jgi:hypothetical protein
MECAITRGVTGLLPAHVAMHNADLARFILRL